MKPFYQDEAVTLFCGDCVSLMRKVSPWDHVITDPPYARDVYVRMSMLRTKDGSGSPPARLGVEAKGANWTKRQGGAIRKMAVGDIGSINDILHDVAKRIGKRTPRWALVFSDVETCYRWRNELEAAGMRYARTGAWVKPDAMPQMTGDRPGTGFEPCTIVHALGPMRWNGGGSLAVWTHFTSKGDSRPDHPCPKPLPLMVELVTLFTDEGDTILDPFAGSGTTGVAAKLNGRKAILIERSEQYCEVAAKRLRQTEPGRLFDKVPRAKPQSLLTEESA